MTFICSTTLYRKLVPDVTVKVHHSFANAERGEEERKFSGQSPFQYNFIALSYEIAAQGQYPKLSYSRTEEKEEK